MATESSNPEELAAQNWFGYGRWNAPYWFIGMEPGGTDDHASYETWMQLGGTELIDCRQHHLASNCLKWHGGDRPATQPTWRRLIQLLLGYKEEPADLQAVSIYQRDRWGTLIGETASLNLSALHAKNLSIPVNRVAFREERKLKLSARLKENRPKFVVFYGKEYIKDYEEVAGLKFDSSGYARHLSTLCFLVQHPASRGSPAADWWIKKGKEIRTCVDRRPGNTLSEIVQTDQMDLQIQRTQTPPSLMMQPKTIAVDYAGKPLPSDVIRVISKTNPKRIGSKSHLRFDCYRDGTTVEEFERTVQKRFGSIEARKCKADLEWDSDAKRRFIRLERDGKAIDILRRP